MLHFTRKLLAIALVLTAGLFMAERAFAYTGTYNFLPAAFGGPGSVDVTRFEVDTSAGPQTIVTNLHYVQSITIETNPAIDSHILIKEYPEGSDQHFDIIVPDPLQDALVSATVYVWAQDTEEILVEHIHHKTPTAYEIATKVIPEQQDSNGNVLWVFTVNSFSSFSLLTSINDDLKRQAPWSGMNGIFLGLTLLASISAPVLIRRTR